MIERLARMVETPSISRSEHVLADLLTRELTDAGLSVSRQGANLWCAVGDAERPRLLFNTHLDTVPPGDGWSGDPWTLREVDGRLIGLGANDAKGCGAAMIEAVLAIKKRLDEGQRLGGTLILALTAEEEISGAGLGDIRPALDAVDAALVGEPTSLTPMIAQRGLLILRGRTQGRSAHPANTPIEGSQNAVMAAVRALGRLHDFDWGTPHDFLGKCHGHVTMINGGVARNVIPDACEFWLDIRTTPNESHESLHKRLSAHLDCALDIHSKRLVSVQTAPDRPIVRACVTALPDASPSGSPAMSDMVFLPDIDAVKIGPGDTRRSHTPDEFVYPAEIEAGAAAYERIAVNYFQLHREKGEGDR